MSSDDLEDLFDTDGGVTSSEPSSTGQDSDDDDSIFEGFEDTDVSTSKGHGTLNIGKKTFAIGLTWNSSIDVGRAKKEARAAAKTNDMDAEFYCVRSGDVVQYGLGSKALGHKAGMPALADRICTNFEGSWLVAFQVGQLYYLAAARDGQILTDCDRIYYDEEDIRERFMSLLTSSDWDTVIAPEAWHIEDADSMDLRQLKLGGRGCRLRQTNPTGTIILYGLAIAAVAGAVGGYFYWEEKQKEQARYEAAQERMNRETRIQSALDAVSDKVAPVLGIDEEREEQEVPPDPPWLGNQNGPGTIIVCVDDIMKAPMNVPGWDTSRVSCRDGTIYLSLDKTGGTVPWAEHYFRENGFPETDFSQYAMSSSLSFTMPASFVSDYGAGLKTRSLETIRRHVLYYFEEYGLEIEWRQNSPNMNVKVDRYYKTATLSFSSPHDPTQFLPILEDIPGMVVDSIELDIGGGKWTVEANVYEKRDRPLPPPQPEE